MPLPVRDGAQRFTGQGVTPQSLTRQTEHMAEPGDPRVAVYFDFDNIVISRYDQVHGRSQFQRDRVRGGFGTAEKPTDAETADKLEQARVDVGAIIDYASSFGTRVRPR